MKKVVLFVISALILMLSGCRLTNPHAVDSKTRFSGNGYQATETLQQTEGMVRYRRNVRVSDPGMGGGAPMYLGPGGTPMQPGGSAVYKTTPDIPPTDCIVTPSGQGICNTDGVIVMMPEGALSQPGDTPNGRLEQRVRRVERRQDATEDQTVNVIEWAQGHCSQSHPCR